MTDPKPGLHLCNNARSATSQAAGPGRTDRWRVELVIVKPDTMIHVAIWRRFAKLTSMRSLRLIVVLTLCATVLACIAPVDRRPGLWLSGQVGPLVEDWSFVNDHSEIFVEVRTPYGIRHSVTVVCASLDGVLYMGARSPSTKRWVGYVRQRPEVRLKIGERIYRAEMTAINDAEGVVLARRAYARKYRRPETPPADAPPIQYYRVVARD